MPCLGFDPQGKWHSSLNSSKNKPREYEALLAALKSALYTKSIQGQIEPYKNDDTGEVYENSIDPDSTMVDLKSVGQFLQSKGIDNPICNQPNRSQLPDYLNPAHSCYAPKLAAAIQAWLAVVSDPKALKGKTPKTAMEKWLRLNAKTYGLTLKDGSPNNTGIEEICKVANWKQSGGAAKTFVEIQPAPEGDPPPNHPPLNYLEEKEDLQDIPF